MTKDLVVLPDSVMNEIVAHAEAAMDEANCRTEDLVSYLKKIMADINGRLMNYEACDVSFFSVVLPIMLKILEVQGIPHEDVAESDVEVRKEFKFGFPPRVERVAYAIRGLVVPNHVKLINCEGVKTATISVARTQEALEKHERER